MSKETFCCFNYGFVLSGIKSFDLTASYQKFRLVEVRLSDIKIITTKTMKYFKIKFDLQLRIRIVKLSINCVTNTAVHRQHCNHTDKSNDDDNAYDRQFITVQARFDLHQRRYLDTPCRNIKQFRHLRFFKSF